MYWNTLVFDIKVNLRRFLYKNSGTRGASRSTGNMYFHGKHILTALLEDMSVRFGLARAASLTLVGTGSGARGVGYNCDYVAR